MSSAPLVPVRGLASDNYAGVLPSVLSALVAANTPAHAPAYGDDPLTKELAATIRRHFGPDAVAFPVFNGTGANVIALQAACPRHAPAVLCAETSHAQCDEGGAPEVVGGLKLHALRVPLGDGKLTPGLLAAALFDRDSVHRSQPSCVSITQTTEMGTVYSLAELRALAAATHDAGLLLHMDGARLSNAAAALGLPLRALTTDIGVDVVSFGGTKAGAMAAEAVIVLNAALLPALPFLRKTAMQLASKQRFIAAQLIALLEGEGGEDRPPPTPLCVRAAAHANAMAARLLAGVRAVPGVQLPAAGDTPMANAIFPILPGGATERLWARGWRFYMWDHAARQVRLMTAWDTTEEDVDSFVEALREEVAAEGGA